MSERLKWLLVGCLLFIPAVTSAQTTNPLDEIIAQVKTGFRQQSRPTVIFDVDGFGNGVIWTLSLTQHKITSDRSCLCFEKFG